MPDTNNQARIDTLVNEIEDEMQNNKTFNAAKHFALWRMDKEKAFEMFEKCISDKSVTLVFDGIV